jgi:hypothetical protein
MWYAQKLAHCDDFKTVQLRKRWSYKLMLARALVEAHLVAWWGELMARMVTRESPSSIRGENQNLRQVGLLGE